MSHDPRPTDDLNSDEAWPFEDGVDEITIRVSRYDFSVKPERPAAFQAIAKRADRTKVWGVGVAGSPVAAIQKAIREAYARADVPWPSGGVAGLSRAPLVGEEAAEEAASKARKPAPKAAPKSFDDDIEDMLG